MPTKKRQTKKPTKTSSKKSVNKKADVYPKKVYKSKGKFDAPIYLAVTGLIGLVIAYFIITRALGTGSWWEYFYSLVFIVLSIRLFIRSIHLI